MSIRLQNFSLSRSEPRADQPLPEPRVLAQHLPIDARFKSAEIGAHPPVQEKGRSFFTLGAPNNASASAFAARPAPPPQVGAQFAFSRGPAGAAGAQKLSFGSQANSTPAAAAAQQVAAQAAAAAAAAELRQVNMQFRAERADLVQKIQQSDAQTAQLRGVEAGLRSEIARLSGLIAESVPRERFESAVQSVLKADGMLLEQSKQVEDVTARLAQLEDVNAAAEQHLSEARAEGESVRTALAAVEARLESAASERDHYRQIHLQALEAKGQAEVSAECAAKEREALVAELNDLRDQNAKTAIGAHPEHEELLAERDALALQVQDLTAQAERAPLNEISSSAFLELEASRDEALLELERVREERERGEAELGALQARLEAVQQERTPAAIARRYDEVSARVQAIDASLDGDPDDSAALEVERDALVEEAVSLAADFNALVVDASAPDLQGESNPDAGPAPVKIGAQGDCTQTLVRTSLDEAPAKEHTPLLLGQYARNPVGAALYTGDGEECLGKTMTLDAGWTADVGSHPWDGVLSSTAVRSHALRKCLVQDLQEALEKSS